MGRGRDYLWIAACLHIGARGHDRDSLTSYLDWAKKSKALVALIGDTFDCGTCIGTRHIGSVWESDESPRDQIETGVRLFDPIRRQVILVTSGNHEMRIENVSSISPSAIFAKRIRAKYERASSVIRWHGLKIFASHGVTGSIMTDLNKVMQAYEGVDGIVLGHVHELIHLPVRRYSVDGSGRVSERTVHLCRAGSFLRDAPYARFALHRPTEIGSIIFERRARGQIKVHAGLP